MASLVLFLEDGTSQVLVLDEGKTVKIGRNPDNDIVIPFKSVSSFHGAIEKGGDGWYLQDLGSSNGTTVNGAPIEEARIQDGARISFGEARGIFYLDDKRAADQAVELDDESPVIAVVKVEPVVPVLKKAMLEPVQAKVAAVVKQAEMEITAIPELVEVEKPAVVAKVEAVSAEIAAIPELVKEPVDVVKVEQAVNKVESSIAEIADVVQASPASAVAKVDEAVKKAEEVVATIPDVIKSAVAPAAVAVVEKPQVSTPKISREVAPKSTAPASAAAPKLNKTPPVHSHGAALPPPASFTDDHAVSKKSAGRVKKKTSGGGLTVGAVFGFMFKTILLIIFGLILGVFLRHAKDTGRNLFGDIYVSSKEKLPKVNIEVGK